MVEENSKVTNPPRYEVVSRNGHISSAKFESAQAAAIYAKECWPDQEQDPERSGKGWDVQIQGAK